MFTVKVRRSDNISLLERVIQKDKKNLAKSDAEDDLEIYSVAIYLDKEGGMDVEKAKKTANMSVALKGGKLLVDVETFRSVNPRYLHVVLRAPEDMSSI